MGLEFPAKRNINGKKAPERASKAIKIFPMKGMHFKLSEYIIRRSMKEDRMTALGIEKYRNVETKTESVAKPVEYSKTLYN